MFISAGITLLAALMTFITGIAVAFVLYKSHKPMPPRWLMIPIYMFVFVIWKQVVMRIYINM